jgi:hypothetical protein
MSLRKYIMGMLVSTGFCWSSWVLILLYLDPEHAGFFGLTLFYLSLFFALVGTVTLIGFYARVRLSHNEVVFSHIRTSFRQGILFALLAIGLLLLQSAQLFSLWTGLLLAIIIVLFEFFFTAKQRMEYAS